jgi:hypothetical protein
VRRLRQYELRRRNQVHSEDTAWEIIKRENRGPFNTCWILIAGGDIGQYKMQTADCRLGTKCRLKIKIGFFGGLKYVIAFELGISFYFF